MNDQPEPDIPIDVHGCMVAPELRALAQKDQEAFRRDKRGMENEDRRRNLYRNPVQAWIIITGDTSGQTRLTLESRRLRYQAERQLAIDEEGAIDEARIRLEEEDREVADLARRAQWDLVTEVNF